MPFIDAGVTNATDEVQKSDKVNTANSRIGRGRSAQHVRKARRENCERARRTKSVELSTTIVGSG